MKSKKKRKKKLLSFWKDRYLEGGGKYESWTHEKRRGLNENNILESANW